MICHFLLSLLFQLYLFLFIVLLGRDKLVFGSRIPCLMALVSTTINLEGLNVFVHQFVCHPCHECIVFPFGLLLDMVGIVINITARMFLNLRDF